MAVELPAAVQPKTWDTRPATQDLSATSELHVVVARLWYPLPDERRRLLQVRIEDRDATFAIFNMLMSKREADKRCAWMEEKGDTVEADV